MTQVLSGALLLLACHRDFVAPAHQRLRDAEALAPAATSREQDHVRALRAWLERDLDRAVAHWERILAEYPADALAWRLVHFHHFWRGRPDDMLASIRRVRDRFDPQLPGQGALLACHAFALEECGHYLEAEAVGRRAVALSPSDLWAAHAVAHTLEMQGRRREGIDWLSELEPHWSRGNNLKHHLWWHRALYHLELGQHDAVLSLYDHGFRRLDSPLVIPQPDLYIDVQNACAMLLRLELQGVAVGDRWTELAGHAERRIGDTWTLFSLPHWMMALAADGRARAQDDLLAQIAEFAAVSNCEAARVAGAVAHPVCLAVRRHRERNWSACLEALRPVLGSLHLLGGSHAQQAILEELFADAAVRAGSLDDARRITERVSARHRVPPRERAGFRRAARLAGASHAVPPAQERGH